MKKTLLAATVGTMLFAGTAFAAPFWGGGLYNEDTNTFINNIQGLDWSSSGSGLATGLATNGQPDTAKFINAYNNSTPFTFNYQASLVGVTGSNGQSINFPGLNSNFEYTLVAQMQEVVSGVAVLGGGVATATFTTQPGGKAYLYYDGGPNSNVASGFGFDDGELVAAFDIWAGQVSTFTATGSTGIGSTTLFGDLISGTLNSMRITPDQNAPFWNIGISRTEGTQNFPPLDSITTTFFDGRGAEGNLPTYSVNSDDLPLKSDQSTKFQPVPEPSTLVLLGMGLFGAACFARRKMNV